MINISFKNEQDTLTIFLDGRIDTTNSEQVQKEIDDARVQNAHKNFVIDADKLEYISSSGLRVMLKLRKAEATMKMINVSSDVYEIFEMTGFTEMINIEKAFRSFSVDGCEIIGKGAKGTVYRYDPETIVKVYKNPDSLPDIQRERELARRAFVLGIPTAISYDVVKVGNSYGSVFELLNAKSFSQLIAEDPAQIEKYISEFATLLKQIHDTLVRKDDMPDVKTLIYKWLDTDKKYLTESDYEKLKKLVDDTPDTLNMIHGDYHTNNIMMQNGETLLIDMDTLSHGHPIFELANVHITYVGFSETDPENVESFLGINREITAKVWDIFIKTYLGTTDKAKIDEVTNKAALLGYTRLLRHTVRRAKDGAFPQATVDFCVEKIHSLLENIDTLEF